MQRLDIYNRDQIKSGKNGDVFQTAAEFEDIVRTYAGLDEEGRARRKAAVSAYSQRYGVKEFTEAIVNVYIRAIDRYDLFNVRAAAPATEEE